MTDRILSGSAWMIGMRWGGRLIGLVSTLILARVLAPDDFGLVAMGTIVAGLLEVIATTGVDLALIRERNAVRDHYDTAWTIQVVEGVVVASLLLLSAPLAAAYFDEPRVFAVLCVLALRPLIEGLQNIGVVDFRRDLDFAREFRFGIYKKLSSFVIVVTLALIWRNYWAMIAGMVAGAAGATIISYRMHDFRPRFSVARLGEIWSFSQWLLVSRVGYFFNQNSDKFVVGGVAGTGAMGGYHVARELASMLASELVFPVRRALFPNFASFVDDRERMTGAICLLLGFVAALVMPLQLGMAAVAEDFVAVLLGDQWDEIVPLVSLLAVYGCAATLALTVEFLLPVTGRALLSAQLAWLELGVLLPALWWVAHTSDPTQIALVRIVIGFVFAPLTLYAVARACQVPVGRLFGAVWRPLVAATLMAFVVRALHASGTDIVFLRLLIDVLTGAVSYAAILMALWWVSGKPDGAEQQVLQRFRSKAVPGPTDC